MDQPFVSIRNHGLSPTHAGKVREILDLGDQMMIITTDRISAFDCILPNPVPGKGRLLNQISTWWFRKLEPVFPNHLIGDREEDFPRDLDALRQQLEGRWVLVRRAERIPVECVVRGYLAGSGMREYREKGTVGGIDLPTGIRPYGRLPEPLFTPTTKEDVGHDRPVTFAELCERIGEELSEKLRTASLAIYRAAVEVAHASGLILVDTKFEFGWIDGRLCVIDEMLTPDSSRYWPGDSIGEEEPLSLDKEYVRNYLAGLDWDRNPPAPELPPAQVRETYDRYRRVYDSLGVGAPTPHKAHRGGSS